MTKVLLERVEWIENALMNFQITPKEAKYELDWIDILLDARDMEL